jgi:hypothetical protein
MYFNMKIYTWIESNILYVYVFLSKFYETIKSKVLKFLKKGNLIPFLMFLSSLISQNVL